MCHCHSDGRAPLFLVNHGPPSISAPSSGLVALNSKSSKILRGGRWRDAMGRIFRVELEGRVYSCMFCRTHLALAREIVSRSFQCRRGNAYLFNSVVNVFSGKFEDRILLSGMHTLADIFCCFCGQNVGWQYVSAHEKSQKYKEGKFVLERGKIVDGNDVEFFIDTCQRESDVDGN